MIKEELDSNRIFILHEFLSTDECMALIRRSKDFSYETGTVGGVIAEGLRNNERILFDDKPLADVLFNRAALWIPKEIDGHQLVRFNERWRFYRYRAGQTFQPHRDGAYMSFQTYEQSEVTFMIYLNDEMTGGETRFFLMQTKPCRDVPTYRSSRPQEPRWYFCTRFGTKEQSCLAERNTCCERM